MSAPDPTQRLVDQLGEELALGECLRRLYGSLPGVELLEHWTQGEFHHDLVFHLKSPPAWLVGDCIVISTNCNGGVKEVTCLQGVPDRWALWHSRCPDNPEFEGTLGPTLATCRTMHWFDPCELLGDDARSELRPSCRRRQRGGGWEYG